jgi:uncharacterized protein YggE
MKKSWIMAGAALLMMGVAARGQQIAPYDDRPRITVTGEAVVNVKPDKIVITLGIETWETNIIVAKQRNNEILKKVSAAVRTGHTGSAGRSQLSSQHRFSDNGSYAIP